MPNPVVCDVVLPFCNALSYLEEALESVLAQRDARCLIHVVDDASTDDTTALRAKYKEHSDVFWYRHEHNVGPYRSLHAIFASLTCEFFAIQDADDISEPDRIAFSIAQLNAGHADIFAASAVTFGDDPDDCGHTLVSALPVHDEERLVNGTMVARRSFFQEINGFADFYCGGDTEFGVRAMYAGARFCLTDRVVSRVRRHPQSLTRRPQTGMQLKESEPRWFSHYRLAVWAEVERRRKLFAAGEKNFRQFGCLDPSQSTTLGGVGPLWEFPTEPVSV